MQTHHLVDNMFLTNCPNDPIIKSAMSLYKKQLMREEQYRSDVRAGLIPKPNWNDTQTWHISDRH